LKRIAHDGCQCEADTSGIGWNEKMGGSKSRRRRRLVVGGGVLACVAGWLHVTSPKRDLEVALGVERLPGSLMHEKVRVDSWQDYSVDGFFEADPEDMRRLLAARPYTEVKVPQSLKMEIGEFRPPLPASSFPDVPRFEVKHVLECQQETDDFLLCQIWVSGDFSKAYIRYATD